MIGLTLSTSPVFVSVDTYLSVNVSTQNGTKVSLLVGNMSYKEKIFCHDGYTLCMSEFISFIILGRSWVVEIVQNLVAIWADYMHMHVHVCTFEWRFK